MILPIKAYPQQNTESSPSEDWYAKGKQALEGETGFGGAKGWLEFAKQGLSENITAEILEDVLGQGELPLSEFFDKLLKEKEQLTEVINDLKISIFQEVNNQLKIAIDSFKKEIEKSDSEHKLEAYLKLVDAYLVMNREQEAIGAYEECQQKLGFGNITSSSDEFKDVFYQIAKIYWKGDVKSKMVSKDAFDSEINKVTDPHFICSFTSDFTKSPLFDEATIKFFPTGKELSSKELTRHCFVVVYLPGEGRETSVKLSNEVTLNKDKNEIRRTIPPSDYKVVIKIPKLSIKDENRIPFRIKLRESNVEECILTVPSTQRNTKLILENKETKKTYEISCNQDTFTKYNILRKTSLPTGDYKVTVQSSIYLFPGQVYNLSFEPAPPMPSQTPWWITAIGIASGISILTSILQ